MDLLVIGGTHFLGRHLVDGALERGWRLTLFNNDADTPALYRAARHLLGDRDRDFGALEGMRWDAVVDTCGFLPEQVRRSATILSGRAANYVFVSSLSVYADHSRHGLSEDDTLQTLPATADPAAFTNEHYPALKVLCEQAAQSCFDGTVALIRPGLIAGPLDPTWRCNYWIDRFRRPGDVLAPGVGENTVQMIDVRDLASFILRACVDNLEGPFNTVAPDPPAVMLEFLSHCAAATGGKNSVAWVAEDFLLAKGIVPFIDMPVWLDAPSKGLTCASAVRAKAAGLDCRPLSDTVRDTAEWLSAHNIQQPAQGYRGRHYGLSPEREAQLLEQWRTVQAS